MFCGERCLSRGKEKWGKEGKKAREGIQLKAASFNLQLKNCGKSVICVNKYTTLISNEGMEAKGATGAPCERWRRSNLQTSSEVRPSRERSNLESQRAHTGRYDRHIYYHVILSHFISSINI